MSTKLFFGVILFAATLFSQFVKADSLIALGGGFTQDRNSLADQSPFTDYAYNLGAFAPLTRGERVLYLGIEVFQTNTNQFLDASTKATLTSTDYMLSLKYAFVQKELFSLTVGFSPYTQAQYKVTSLTKDTWYGTSYTSKFSIQPDLGLTGSKLKIAASVLYYQSAYTKKTNSSDATSSSGSQQSANRSFFMPTIEFIFKF